ncbi:xanthine dehydrogenase family protein molybdopterin-binding subunit [Pseudonocardia bannensis]|uniref:Xanthine dehydrogenase family protein molybdopterin-binding subunit n=1 Tax=Pseudonocardia bannensis TaxID=630973 RepID=A0A848DHH5_9PSEU|nr:xanthine dehydrogenase family protein molybdopterin-binding subunit [Pseudonocardia bannensis]NMH92005.1 xanthine dehydrogenase family protein molybdopterin-binding subunit [Pseudonocardia bannensis]
MTVTEPLTVRPPQYVGARVLRVEDNKYLMGRGRYLDDLALPGMLQAAFVRSPHAHARIASIDISAAKALKGVVEVLTGAELAKMGTPLVADLQREEVLPVGKELLATDKVRHVGEAVAIVIAESRYLAEDGAQLVSVEYEPLPALVDPEQALSHGAVLLHDDVPGNNVAHIEFDSGGVEEAFAKADRVFTKRFHAGRQHAAPLETRGVMADYNPGTGHLTIWSSTQLPHFLRTLIAPHLQMSERHLTVIAPDVGGGFGLKCHVFVEEAIIPLVAKRLRRPVKWVEDRVENLAASGHAKEIVMDIDIAVTNDGRFLAFRGRYIGDCGAYSGYPWTALIDPLAAANLLPSLYDVREMSFQVDAVLTNKCQTTAYRGPGMAPGHLARETLIDDIAHELGMDPVELRIKNCIGPEPYVTVNNMRFDGGSYVESIRKAQELVDYDRFREAQAAARAEGRYLGIGFSPFVEAGTWGSEGAKALGFPAEFYDTASVTVEPDGTVTVTTGTFNHGQGHHTSLAQLAADRLGVRIENVRVVDGDTSKAVWGAGTYASRSAVVAGGSILYAATEVRNKLLALAGSLLEASPDDIELYDGQASIKGVPEKSLPIAQLAGVGYFGGALRPEGQEPTLSATRYYDPPQTYSNGVVVAIVEVDAETGRVDLQRVVAVEDCGTMLNPLIVEGQVHGAVAQGIGAALYESLEYDESGQLLSGTLMDFLYPSSTEVPTIEVSHIVTPSPVTEGGMKGMAEGGTIAAPAAVINAIADALTPFGAVIRHAPVRPADVLALIEAGRA